MRADGEVLLVACYELGHQPLAVAWPTAFLERAGFRPAVIDVSVEPFDAERVRRARLVAVSVPMHTALRIGITVARRVRAVNRDCHVCFFGLYATLNAEYLLAHGVDSVIGGEPEDPLVELAESLEARDGRALSFVTTARHAAAPHLRRSAFPVPSRAALPTLDSYAHLERDGGRQLAAYTEASRGCRHLCRHCPIPPVYGGRFFAVPVETVLADIRQQIAAGAAHVTFGDPDFLNGPTHALRVARALHAEFPAVTFDFTAKIEHLLRDREYLPELAAQGCLFIVTAAESLSDVVLQHLAKGHRAGDIRQALAVVRGAGIDWRPTWVAFTPWTRLNDYLEMLDFIDAEHLVDEVEPVQYSLRLLVPPGSLLLESDAMREHLGSLDEATFSHRWTHPDPAMDRLQDAVTAVVTEAAERGDDYATVFDRVCALAADAAGVSTRPHVPEGRSRDRRRPPRLSEPWFC